MRCRVFYGLTPILLNCSRSADLHASGCAASAPKHPIDASFPKVLTGTRAGQFIVALYTAGGVDHVAYMHANLLAVDLTGAAHEASATVPCTVTAYQVRSSFGLLRLPSACLR